MAKSQSGLPEDFDLNVSASDLAGPAALPGYLDDDPVIAFANMQKAKKQVQTPPVESAPKIQQVPPAQVARPVVPPAPAPMQQVAAQPASVHGFAEVPPKALRMPVERKRFQINLDVESERMLEEMLDLLSSQSSENRIKTSELFQALLLILHNAKGEIALGSLPTRGRWGSATAKAFPVNLAEALREAIVAREQESGGNPFAKIVGG